MALDLTSLFLSTININEVHKIVQTSLAKNNNSNYPPYNIIKLSETIFRISIALAGFTKNNVEILLESNVLIIRSINKKSVENLEYLYKGIANRAFEKKFQLAENVKVTSAYFKCGLLNVDLEKMNQKKKLIKIDILEKS